MNKTVASKQLILDTAKEIAINESLSNLNIRAVAAKCNISVGSIYNYYPSKTDLILAIIEDFWKHEIFMILNNHNKTYFIAFIEEVFDKLSNNLAIFKSGLLQQMASLSADDKKKGRQLEAQYLNKIKNELLLVLENDSQIKKDIWTDSFTKNDFVSFVFKNIFSLFHQKQQDLAFFLELLKKILYN